MANSRYPEIKTEPQEAFLDLLLMVRDDHPRSGNLLSCALLTFLCTWDSSVEKQNFSSVGDVVLPDNSPAGWALCPPCFFSTPNAVSPKNGRPGAGREESPGWGMLLISIFWNNADFLPVH